MLDLPVANPSLFIGALPFVGLGFAGGLRQRPQHRPRDRPLATATKILLAQLLLTLLP